ncbi:MAG: cytochrome c-type biogenesis protein CcmH [Vicinamibacterales bacterium]|nr:cytochrome c-type biogenesis protein CcmH [Vicinamibacterales bacterium]
MPMMSQLVLAFWLALAAPDPAALEREAKVIEGLLIAPCCWSQQVSLHQSPASDEIKQAVRRLLAEGKTRQQILDVYVAEYGDRILSEPPARGFSTLIYVLPWVFLAGSVGLVVLVIRKLRSPAGESAAASGSGAPAGPPTEDEGERIDEELRNLD